jgi:hypothetical protein
MEELRKQAGTQGSLEEVFFRLTEGGEVPDGKKR